MAGSAAWLVATSSSFFLLLLFKLSKRWTLGNGVHHVSRTYAFGFLSDIFKKIYFNDVFKMLSVSDIVTFSNILTNSNLRHLGNLRDKYIKLN